MAYDHQEVSFIGAKTVAVVGENGSGKSAFLESIPYAYYGIGRGTLSELSRLTGDGTHKVVLEHLDIPNQGDKFVIERGQNKSGKGFVKVYLNDELIGKGATASEKIIEIIGMSQDLFMLTAFFGLGDDKKSDTLIKVSPADRLETLQRLANVGIYKQYYKKADTEYKAIVLKQDIVESAIEAMESVLADLQIMKQDIKNAEVDIEKYTVDLAKFRVQKETLLQTEEQYRLAVQRRDALEKDQNNIQKDIIECQDELKYYRSDLEDTQIELGTVRKGITKCKQDIKNVDYKALEKDRDKIAEAGTSKKTLKELRNIVLESDVADNCPLCGSPVTGNMIEIWQGEVVTLTGEIEGLKKKYAVNADKRKAYTKLESLLQNLNNTLTLQDSKYTTATVEIKKYEQSYKVLQSKKVKVDADYVKVSRTIGKDAMSVSERITSISDDMENLQKSTGEAETIIRLNKLNIKKYTDDVKKKVKLETQLVTLKAEEKAFAVLQKAFHRYGIPLNLLRGMNQKLGKFATKVYQEFDNGAIEVKETEGARPGLEFVLSDRKGTRRWGLLSLGEKVMFFISIRVALTKIIEEAVNARINFVILDEIMGNLSPKKQTDMVRVASKILRKVFPQVVIVSHTSMNDIFDRSFMVEQDNELSTIEVM